MIKTIVHNNKLQLYTSKESIKSRGLFIFVVLIFRLFLDLSYVYIISPIYEYAGFVVQIDLLKLIESYLLTFLLALIIPSRTKKPSDFFVVLLFLLPVLPTISLYGLRAENRAFIYMMLVGFLTVLVTCTLPEIKLRRLKGGRNIGVFICGIAVVVVFVWLIRRGGLGYFNLDLTRVYEFRREVGAAINIGFWAYLNAWVFKVFNVALIAWALFRKRYLLLLLFIGLQVVFFAISSHKSVLFYPFLVIALYGFIERKYALHLIVLGLLGLVGVCSAIALFTGNILPASLFIRRVIFVPASLNYAYYEFFSQAGHVFMSNSVLSFFIKYPFPYPPTQMISEFLLGHTNCWANNGFLATSYMHFGFPGGIIFSFVVGLLVRTVDVLVVGKLPLRFGITLVIVPFFSLFTSADLGTALLTHGLAISLLLLWLFSSREMPNKAALEGK